MRATGRLSSQNLLRIFDRHAVAYLQKRAAHAAVDLEAHPHEARGAQPTLDLAGGERLTVREHERRGCWIVSEAQVAAELDTPLRVGDVGREILEAACFDLFGGGPVSQQHLAQPRLAPDQRLSQEQLAERGQVVVGGLARKRAHEAVTAAERSVDLRSRVVVLELDA